MIPNGTLHIKPTPGTNSLHRLKSRVDALYSSMRAGKWSAGTTMKCFGLRQDRGITVIVHTLSRKGRRNYRQLYAINAHGYSCSVSGLKTLKRWRRNSATQS
jgi:hypothetical protein